MPRPYEYIPKPTRKRLDRHRFDGLPLAKDLRVIDNDVMEEARQRPRCEWCGASVARAIAAHARPRGGHGDDCRLNIVSHCPACEMTHHAGGEPTVYQMLEVARLREAGRIGDWHPRIAGKRLGIPRGQ